MTTCKIRTVVSWMLQLLVAAILAQTLFFKFSGAEESKYIFTKLGVEPWGRVATGGAELVAVVLLLVPRGVKFGAVLALGLMTGAIFSHLTALGIAVKDDGGLLFGLAVTVWVGSSAILIIRRHQPPGVGDSLVPRPEMGCATKGCLH